MTKELKARLATIRRGEVPEGYQRTKVGVVPEEWEVLEIGQITAELKSGLSRLLNEYDIGVPVLRSNNIRENLIDFTELKYWYLVDPQGATVSDYFLKDNDIIINFINSLAQIGKTAIYKNTILRDVIYTTNLLKFVPNNKMNVEFFFYFTLSERYRTEITAISKPAVNQASFTTVDFKRIKIQCPSLPEQEKIATILSTQDKVIELKEQLIAQKQQQKKYLMQQLLTGKKYPATRLKQVASPLTQRNNCGNSNVLTISAQFGLINQEDYFKKEIASENKEGYFLLKKDDFAYNKSYSNGYPSGAIKRLVKYESGIVSPLYICFRANSEKVSLEYLECYFEAGLMNREIQAFAQEGARNHGLLNIAKGDFFNSKLYLPPLPEQQTIAAILTTADRELALLRQELEQEKQKKKALMQLLLTGIVRVTI